MGDEPTYYDPVQRRLEKQRAREQDDRDLAEGKITREELSKKNSFFHGLDFKNAKIVRGKIPKL